MPTTSFTRLLPCHLPTDYSRSDTTHYIHRGWSNRRTSLYDTNLVSYDVHTQTDDSFLQSSNTSTSVGMRRSLLSMFTMNLALIMKLIFKLYPSVYSCLLTGEFFQVEKQAADDLTVYLSSMMGASCPQIYVNHLCQHLAVHCLASISISSTITRSF
jgi:hypothetical protein